MSETNSCCPWLSWVGVLALIIAVLALLAAVVAHVLGWTTFYRWNVEGPTINVITGTSASSGTFETGKESLYFVGSNSSLTDLRILPNDLNERGRFLYIKNITAHGINLNTSSLAGYAGSNTVEAGAYAVFIFIGRNDLLRLQ